MSTIVKIPASILRRRLAFWQSHGLIIESSPNIYRLQEDNNLGKNELEQMPIAELLPEDEEYSESAMASASDQREEELQVIIINFIKSVVVIILLLFIRYSGPILLVC